MSDEVDKKMSVGTRDKQMSDMASVAAEAFCEKHFSSTTDYIKNNPEEYLKHTVPYITVRTLHPTRRRLKVWKLIPDGSNS
jgi:hypothetical protein